MTTAILRPPLHNRSIKLFYDELYQNNKEEINNFFDIYHIINIDSPEILKSHFTINDTINNFNNIIPEQINKTYIVTENPSFLQAYKNLMDKVKELDLLSENNLYWWFEDDWTIIKNNKFFTIIKLLLYFKNSGLTLTRNCQIGSFRGGPIMTGYYFMNYFNLQHIGVGNNHSDPERQVARYIGAKIPIHNSITRSLVNYYDKKISLVISYFDIDYGKISADFSLEYYTEKFNKEIEIDCHIIKIDNYNYDNFLYIKYNKDAGEYIKNKYNYINMNIEQLKYILGNDSITYFICKPYCFEDCGREYAQLFNTTYFK